MFAARAFRTGICFALVVVMMLGGLFTAKAAAEFATVNNDSVNVREAPSVGSKSAFMLMNGNIVRILWQEGEWYRISFGDKEGYIREDYLKMGASAASDLPEDGASGYTAKDKGRADILLKLGDENQEVANMQAALKRKGYFFSKPTGYFGELTQIAVMDFQKHNNLDPDGVAGASTLKLLYGVADDDSFANEAPEGKMDIALRFGDKDNEQITIMQMALRAKGYFEAELTDNFGPATLNAVKEFQNANGLTDDGIAGMETLKLLYGEGKSKPAEQPNAGGAAPKAVSTPAVSGNGIERIAWFGGEIQELIPVGAVVTVTDTRTGLSFHVKRMGGTNHADVEPLTANDTAIMKQIRGAWSWDRRPLLVHAAGRTVAASWNGMPHGSYSIAGNNFPGHFCIHFYTSRTHSSNQIDDAHQSCVNEAFAYSP